LYTKELLFTTKMLTLINIHVQCNRGFVGNSAPQ